MNLQEVSHVKLLVADLCTKILKEHNAESQANLIGLLGDDQEKIKVQNIGLTVPRLVLDHDFLPMVEEPMQIDGKVFLNNMVIGQTTKLIANKGFVYNAADTNYGLPPQAFLRTASASHKVLHATLNVAFIGVNTASSDKIILIKKLYYNKDFFPISEDTD